MVNKDEYKTIHDMPFFRDLKLGLWHLTIPVRVPSAHCCEVDRGPISNAAGFCK